MTFLHFLGKFKNGPFWPKLTQIWPKFGHLAQKTEVFYIFLEIRSLEFANFLLEA